MTFLVKLIIAIKVLFWVAVVVLVFSFSDEIGSFFTGAVDRFDYTIGYKAK